MCFHTCVSRKSCIWRNFNERNESRLNDWLYGVETYFHEQMLNSPHRCGGGV